MEIVQGKITEFNERSGGFSVFVPYTNIDRACLREYDEVQVGLPDWRTITPEQRAKAHCIINEIGEWQGEHTETMKKILKLEFIVNRMQSLEKTLFSLSDCDVTTAREFITFLIDFVVEWGVPTKKPLLELCEDIEKAVYACLMHKKCILCGKKAELHHFDQIGMGGDRTTMYQIGMRVVPLCRECHTTAHQKGAKWLTEDMYVSPIPLNAEIGKVYRLNKKNLIKE